MVFGIQTRIEMWNLLYAYTFNTVILHTEIIMLAIFIIYYIWENLGITKIMIKIYLGIW